MVFCDLRYPTKLHPCFCNRINNRSRQMQNELQISTFNISAEENHVTSRACGPIIETWTGSRITDSSPTCQPGYLVLTTRVSPEWTHPYSIQLDGVMVTNPSISNPVSTTHRLYSLLRRSGKIQDMPKVADHRRRLQIPYSEHHV